MNIKIGGLLFIGALGQGLSCLGLEPTAGPFIKPNKQMLEASGKKKKIPYKKGPTFKIKIK
jgi:hypothetical protein